MFPKTEQIPNQTIVLSHCNMYFFRNSDLPHKQHKFWKALANDAGVTAGSNQKMVLWMFV